MLPTWWFFSLIWENLLNLTMSLPGTSVAIPATWASRSATQAPCSFPTNREAFMAKTGPLPVLRLVVTFSRDQKWQCTTSQRLWFLNYDLKYNYIFFNKGGEVGKEIKKNQKKSNRTIFIDQYNTDSPTLSDSENSAVRFMPQFWAA